MAKIKDLTGKKFNHWDVYQLSYICDHGDAMWTCQCDLCGDFYSVRSDSLQSGNSTKCRRCANFESRYGYARTI